MTYLAQKYFPFLLAFAVIAATISGAFFASFSVEYVSAESTMLAGRVNPTTELKTTGQAALGESARATDPRAILFAFVGVLLSLTGIVLTLLFLYAGFLWFSARGNDDQVMQAKKTLTNAVVGLIIVAMSYAIVTFVIRALYNPQAGISCAEMFDVSQGSTTEIILEQTLPFCGS